MYKIGYIDEEDGARSSFYNLLEDDYSEIKLFDLEYDTSVESLTEEMIKSNLDLIVIDYQLSGDGRVDFNADELITSFKKKKPHFPLIILTSNKSDALKQIHNTNIIYRKEEDMGDRSSDFKKILLENIEDYQALLRINIQRIEELSIILNERSLSNEEEEELSKLLVFENELDPEDKDLASHLVSLKEVGKINALMNDAKEIKEILLSLQSNNKEL